MKNPLRLMTVWILIFGLFAQAQNFDSIPDGYQAGRSDVPKAAYYNSLSKDSEGLYEQLTYLRKKSFGLQINSTLSAGEMAATVTEMEIAILNLYMDINESKLQPFEKNLLLQEAVQVYQNVRFINERLFEDTIRFLDIALPGPNGLQVPFQKGQEGRLYYPNYRTEVELSSAERTARYLERLQEFQKKGGSLDEIKVFSKELVATWGTVTFVEYVELSTGEVHVTEGKAGHVLLAAGKRVRTAGQIVLIKDPAGHPSLLIITNASGNYKPDILQVTQLGQRLTRKLHIPLGHLVVTKGEPISSQIYKLQLKARGTQADEMKAQSGVLDDKIKLFLKRQSQPVCSAEF